MSHRGDGRQGSCHAHRVTAMGGFYRARDRIASLEHLSIICSGWAGLRYCGVTSGCIQEASRTVFFCWPRRGRAYLAQGAGLGESRLAGTNGDQALGIRSPHAPSPGGAAVVLTAAPPGLGAWGDRIPRAWAAARLGALG